MPEAGGLMQVTRSQPEHNPSARFVEPQSTDSFFSRHKPIGTDSLWKWFASTVPCTKLQRNLGNVSLGNAMGSVVLGHALWLISHWGKLTSKSRELQHLGAFWPNTASQEKRVGCMKVLGFPLSLERG